MKIQIQTASELKNSSLTRTLAHETRKIRMKIISMFFFCFFISFAFSQDEVHTREGFFLKRVEHNLIMLEAKYNLDSKGDVEKLFFGDFNAPVEFFYAGVDGYSGLRIVKDSLDTSSYIIEIKYIPNFEEVRKLYPPHWLSLYRVETISFPISEQFAKKIHHRMSLQIENFKARGLPLISVGGYTATFRVVVDDEVWSLFIGNPQGKYIRKMADLCREIITDALDNQLDESKYISVLNCWI